MASDRIPFVRILLSPPMSEALDGLSLLASADRPTMRWVFRRRPSGERRWGA